MKPHEETWQVAVRHGFSGPDLVESADSDPALVCSVWASRAGFRKGKAWEDSAARAKLLAAAPELARALLVNGYVRDTGDGQWHADACNHLNDGGPGCFASCEQARAALKKAGVL